MKQIRIVAVAAFAAGALIHNTRADAALPVVYCAKSATDIKNAFYNAKVAAEGTQHDIRIITTNSPYSIDTALNFDPDGSHDNKDFSVSGGWNSDCSGPQTINPANTVLTFTSASSGARNVLLSGNNHSYAVRGIRFDHAANFAINEPACLPFEICPDTQSVSVEFNDFRYLSQVDLEINDARTLAVRNNLFARFTGSFGNDLVRIFYLNSETMPVIDFNTFAAMQCGSGGSVLRYFTAFGGENVLDHNIFQQTGCDYDLYFDDVKSGGQAVTLLHNLYQKTGGKAPTASSAGNKTLADPGFTNPAANDFTLRTSPASPAINAGLSLTQIALEYLTFPSQDLDGPDGERLQGEYFDLGAFESTGSAPTYYVVSNTNDSGAGSLRDAITQANNNPGEQTIQFAIPGACPQKIQLSSPLPDITDDVTINGYEQPGANLNASAVASTANLCVIVSPAFGTTVDHAIRVPSTAAAATRLELSGIAFSGGFSTAVYLAGGTGHLIRGNAFGGVRPGGVDALGSAIVSHITVRGNAAAVAIGGPHYWERNWFGSSQLNAILLLDATSGGHTIRNNYVGLDPGGAVPQPLGANGISAQDSAIIDIEDNVIDSGSAGIRVSGAKAHGYTIKGNRIGQDAYGGQGALAANGNGILITGGAYGNTIGTFDGKTASNIIANNKKAGVSIDSTAGSGNVVRPNSIYGNGTSGSGLGIDLGALGPLANDALDPDAGPNASQNAPVLTASLPNNDAEGTRQVKGKLNSAPSTTFDVDIYRSPGCAGGNRGGDARTLLNTQGVYTVMTGADGTATFSVKEPGAGAPGYITAVATNTLTGDTSEIGACFFEDTIFKDGTDGGF